MSQHSRKSQNQKEIKNQVQAKLMISIKSKEIRIRSERSFRIQALSYFQSFSRKKKKYVQRDFRDY